MPVPVNREQSGGCSPPDRFTPAREGGEEGRAEHNGRGDAGASRAALRHRIETTTGELTERLGLAHYSATTVWGLLTRTAATIQAQTSPAPGLRRERT